MLLLYLGQVNNSGSLYALVFFFQLSIGGYNQKQKVLLTKILEKMTTFKVDPKRFEIFKEMVC